MLCTRRHWAWTLGLAFAVSAAFPLQTSSVSFAYWSTRGAFLLVPWFAGAGCLFLLGVLLVEALAWPRIPPMKAYLAGGLAAGAACIALAGALAEHVPRGTGRVVEGRVQRQGPAHVQRTLIRNHAMIRMGFEMTFHGLLATLIYGSLRRSRQAEEALAKAELARASSRRHLASLRLQAGQAAIDPDGILASLREIESVYSTDRLRADVLMDALIEQLRAAIPKIRDGPKVASHEAHGAAG
jgi:hypothetical protein